MEEALQNSERSFVFHILQDAQTHSRIRSSWQTIHFNYETVSKEENGLELWE